MNFIKPQLLAAILLTLSVLSCVKDPQDIPNGYTSDPAFHFSGSFGGDPVQLTAGEYQWSAVPVITTLDSSIAYTSVFSLNGCTEQCTPSWTFNMYQVWPSTGNSEETFTNTIHEGPVYFVPSSAERDSFSVDVSIHPDLFNNGFSFWQDNNTSTTYYSNEYVTTLGYNQDLDICFESIALSGCRFEQCFQFDPVTLIPCQGYIQPQLESARHLVLSVKPEGIGPFDIRWMNGSTSSNIVVQLQDSVATVLASVSITDANGNQTQLKQTIRVQNEIVDACYFPISIQPVKISNHSPSFNSGRLEVAFRDEEGMVWRSSVQPIAQDDHAEIVDVAYFSESPSGDPTYMVTLKMNVHLTNETTGASKTFTAPEIVLPFSYPK